MIWLGQENIPLLPLTCQKNNGYVGKTFYFDCLFVCLFFLNWREKSQPWTVMLSCKLWINILLDKTRKSWHKKLTRSYIYNYIRSKKFRTGKFEHFFGFGRVTCNRGTFCINASLNQIVKDLQVVIMLSRCNLWI